MKTIELYTVEWRDGYERHTEHDVSLDTMRSWFEDGGGGNADEYADEFKVISDLAVGDHKGFDFTHGMGEMMRITKTTQLEQGYCRIEGGAVYECYYPKQRSYWNGWACPAGLTDKSLCDFLAVTLEGRDNPADLELCMELLTSIEEHQYGDVTLFSIGDGLIWEECTEEFETPNYLTQMFGHEDDDDDDDDSWEGRCGDCDSYGQRGTTCNNCKRGIYSREIA